MYVANKEDLMSLFVSFITQLQNRSPLPPLVANAVWNKEISQQVDAADDATLLGDSNIPSTRKEACRAGLLLWNDDLNASHSIAQNIEDATGSYWHAIVHRREGDYANSIYWWRRTGEHPAFAAVYKAVLKTLQNESDADAQSFMAAMQRAKRWQPIEFVKACERAQKPADDTWLRRAQVAEIEALLNWCCGNNQ
jgi:hypothetical protein